MTKQAIMWSSEHTLGHIAISADNPIAKYFKKKNAEQEELPCDLVAAGKFRNGNPRWWCRTHQIHFGVKGEQLENPSCRNAKMLLDYCTNPLEINPLDYPGGIGIWAALPPAIDTSNQPWSIGIHVHCRKKLGGKKEIDETFPAVRVKISDPLGITYDWIDVTPPAAKAYLEAKIKNIELDSVSCSYCSAKHLDLADFAKRPHRKHLCGNCGRDFWVKHPTTSNPLLELSRACEGLSDRKNQPAEGLLDLTTDEYPNIKIWPSTPAILWTNSRSEVTGIHVHAYDSKGVKHIDETYNNVILNGVKLERQELVEKLLKG